MNTMDPIEVLREKLRQIDNILDEYVKHSEALKRERTALMVAIAAMEREERR